MVKKRKKNVGQVPRNITLLGDKQGSLTTWGKVAISWQSLDNKKGKTNGAIAGRSEWER